MLFVTDKEYFFTHFTLHFVDVYIVLLLIRIQYTIVLRYSIYLFSLCVLPIPQLEILFYKTLGTFYVNKFGDTKKCEG